jgi:hypothetical protein
MICAGDCWRGRTGGVCHYDIKWLEGGRFHGFAAGAGLERGSCGAPFVADSAVVDGFQCIESLVERGTGTGMCAVDEPYSVCICVTECAVKRVVSCGDAGHCVDSVRMGDVDLVYAADFGAAVVDQFCGGW